MLDPEHLNTPRVITDGAGQVVWRWDQGESFGSDPANSNPSGAGNFEFNLRFPGQYFDKESSLHYNFFRDYDSAIGRYVQSDPIGIGSGVNTYTYAVGNPLANFDPSGLACVTVGKTTTCAYPGGPKFSIPASQDFPAEIGLAPLYHRYHVSRSTGCVSDADALQSLINNPTPGHPAPATASGTRNNALIELPFGDIDNPVTSYVTTDLNTGATLVVNITGPGSYFPSGYVARMVSNGKVHTFGEGNNFKQSPLVALLVGGPNGVALQAIGTDAFWGAQTKQLLNQCTCKR